MERYDVNYYSWLHSHQALNRTKIYLSEKNPTFARLKFETGTIPILHDF